MAYKQSPFPMIAGTSPVKSKTWLAKQALKYGTKAVNWAKGKLATTATKAPKTTVTKTATQTKTKNPTSWRFVDRVKSGKTAVETYKHPVSGKIKQHTFVDTPKGPKRLLQPGESARAFRGE